MHLRAITNQKKREVLDRLYNAWISVPEFRLGQMLHNKFEDRLFYIEDYELIEELEDKNICDQGS